MSLRAEYLALKRLQNNADYKILESRWFSIVSDIQKSRDSAASRGQESAWRYYAGQEKGAQRMITALALALVELEQQDKDLVDESKYEDLLREVRGEKV